MSISGLGSSNQLASNANRSNLLKLALQNTNQASTLGAVAVPSQAAQWRGSNMPPSAPSPPRKQIASNSSSARVPEETALQRRSNPIYEQPTPPKQFHLGMFEIGRPLGKGK